MWRAAQSVGVDLETDLRRQIRTTGDLAALVRELGFDIDFAARARDLVAALEATIRAEVRDFAALKAALTAARAQVTGAGVRFDVADRALLDEVEAAGDDQAAIHQLLNRNPVSAQLPFVERIPVMRGGLVSWRTPVDHTIIRKRPSDRIASGATVSGKMRTCRPPCSFWIERSMPSWSAAPRRQPRSAASCFFNLLETGADAVDRNNLAPMKQLDEWLQTRVALNVHHEATTRFLPDLVEAVSEQEQAGAEILALSTLTYHTDLREPKPILARSWVLAEGKKHRCPHARPGVIVLGQDRGRLLQVCIAKK